MLVTAGDRAESETKMTADWVQESGLPAGETTTGISWLTHSDKSGFSFQHPPKHKIVQVGTGGVRQGIGVEGGPADVPPVLQAVIFHPISNDQAYNPKATSLNDYKRDYQSDHFSIIIHSQTELVVNGFPALKQVFSAGEWREDKNGYRFFDTSGEYAAYRRTRYVFFDNKSRLVIMNTDFDELAQSFRFRANEW